MFCSTKTENIFPNSWHCISVTKVYLSEPSCVRSIFPALVLGDQDAPVPFPGETVSWAQLGIEPWTSWSQLTFSLGLMFTMHGTVVQGVSSGREAGAGLCTGRQPNDSHRCIFRRLIIDAHETDLRMAAPAHAHYHADQPGHCRLLPLFAWAGARFFVVVDTFDDCTMQTISLRLVDRTWSWKKTLFPVYQNACT